MSPRPSGTGCSPRSPRFEPREILVPTAARRRSGPEGELRRGRGLDHAAAARRCLDPASAERTLAALSSASTPRRLWRLRPRRADGGRQRCSSISRRRRSTSRPPLNPPSREHRGASLVHRRRHPRQPRTPADAVRRAARHACSHTIDCTVTGAGARLLAERLAGAPRPIPTGDPRPAGRSVGCSLENARPARPAARISQARARHAARPVAPGAGTRRPA